MAASITYTTPTLYSGTSTSRNALKIKHILYILDGE